MEINGDLPLYSDEKLTDEEKNEIIKKIESDVSSRVIMKSYDISNQGHTI